MLELIVLCRDGLPAPWWRSGRRLLERARTLVGASTPALAMAMAIAIAVAPGFALVEAAAPVRRVQELRLLCLGPPWMLEDWRFEASWILAPLSRLAPGAELATALSSLL